MAKMYYDQDADLALLSGKTIAIIGFGSQGHAHALNLQDSGCNVVVGLYPGSASWQKAEGQGLKVMTVAEAAAAGDIVMILVPDNVQPKLYREEIAPHLTAGKTLMFAHGFNIRFGQIVPPPDVDVSMIAPKSPGHRVRELYVDGGGHAGAPGRVPEPLGQGQGAGPGLRHGRRLHPRRRHRDHLRRRDRDRPLRRAGRPVRRRHPPDRGRLRHPGGGRLPAGDRLL